MFLRTRSHHVYHLDMNNFQMKSDKQMNYFRTELMRYYMHNYKGMNEVQRQAILDEIPFNTHFNWHFNLVSVLSCLG